MRSAAWLAVFVLAVAAGSGFAEEKSDRLQKDWPKLEGTWVTPYVPTADGKTEKRARLELTTSGDHRVFTHYEEIKTGDGAVEKVGLHNAVLVVVAVRKKGGKTYLVVCPKTLPQRRNHEHEIQYELSKGKLKLDGSLGTAKLTGTWVRADEKK
jgi:hypothetical protein